MMIKRPRAAVAREQNELGTWPICAARRFCELSGAERPLLLGISSTDTKRGSIPSRKVAQLLPLTRCKGKNALRA